MNHVPLFEGKSILLTPIEPDKDAPAIANWTYDLDTAARLREEAPARPMAVFEVKSLYERWQKEANETRRQYLFAIRTPDDQTGENRMIGVLRVCHIEWVHGAAYLDLIMGNPQDWEKFGHETLDLALQYAFEEMGLFRVTAVIAEHNQPASNLFSQANFTLEVRQRQAVYWNKRAWDKLYYGLLRPEWKLQRLAEAAA
jgi:RimJ/RimL family protein N-acetyltransferase